MKNTRAFFAFPALCLAGLYFAAGTAHADMLAPTAGRIDPLEPIVLAKPISPTSELTYQKRKAIEAQQPKIQPLPQRVKMLNENTMLLLPEENPIVHTGLSADDLRQTVQPGTTLHKPELPTVEAPRDATLKARVLENADGEKILQLQGSSKGKSLALAKTAQIKTTTAPSSPTTTTPNVNPPKSPATPTAQAEHTQQLQAIKLTYFADSITPEHPERWQAFVKKLEGKTVKTMRVIAQNPPATFGSFMTLPKERWNWVQGQLSDAGITVKGVTTSELLLTHAGESFLELILLVE